MPRQGILEGNTSSPCLPTPLARPDQARPPDRTCLLSPPERDGVQEQMESYDSGPRAGPRQVSKRAEIGPDRAHMPRGRGSAPSRLASRTDLGSDTLTQAAPASQPEPEAPSPPKGRRDPARCGPLNAVPRTSSSKVGSQASQAAARLRLLPGSLTLAASSCQTAFSGHEALRREPHQHPSSERFFSAPPHPPTPSPGPAVRTRTPSARPLAPRAPPLPGAGQCGPLG